MVDGLDAGTPACVQTLPEVILRLVVQNESGPSLCVVEVGPEYGALAPSGIALPSRRGSLGRRVGRHDGSTFLNLRGPNSASQTGILRPLGPWRPRLLPLSFLTAPYLLAAQGGGDMGLADPGVDCAPLFTTFRGASATGAAFCFWLKR